MGTGTVTQPEAVAVLLDAVVWHGHRINDTAIALLDPKHQTIVTAAQTIDNGKTWEDARARLEAVAATGADIRTLFGLWCDHERPVAETVTDALTVLWRASERRRLARELQNVEVAKP